MTARILRLVSLLCLVSLTAAPAWAKRIALVIGNDNYSNVARLEKAGNDADSMARELELSGFQVKKHRDLNFKQMVVAFEDFFDQIKGGDEVVMFYAGHGVQTERGSYLLPTDIEGETQSQIEKISYSVNGLLEELDKVKPRFSLVIVDACRDNPLRSRGRTIGVARGLNAPDLAKGQMVVFSAGRNQRALDSLNDKDANPNGVFTREFVARMRKPGLNVEALALEVKNSVERLARTVNHDQRPLIVNDSTGDFYFHAPQAGSAAAQSLGPAAESAREDQFWQDTKAPDNIEGYEAYLSTYPAGRYAGLARANISRLRANTANQQTAPPSGGASANAAQWPVVASNTAPRAPSPAAPTTPIASVPAASPAAAGTPAPSTSTRSYASYSLSNGDKYEGDVVGVMRTGTGKYSFSNGDRYEGGLQDNIFNGKGTMTFAYGDRYEGDYVLGMKHGRGVYLFANKDRFEGRFANNLYEGPGRLSYANGDAYDGNYVRGIKQGAGVYRFANGDRYEGNFSNNVFSGKGKLFLANGDRYEGEFRDNAKEGGGVHHFANNERYEGTFHAGSQSGNGTHYFSNGDRYTGVFERGVRNGKGIHTFANGLQKALEYANGAEKSN